MNPSGIQLSHSLSVNKDANEETFCPQGQKNRSNASEGEQEAPKLDNQMQKPTKIEPQKIRTGPKQQLVTNARKEMPIPY